MPYRALSPILLGQKPPADAGDLIPDTFVNMDGREEPVDFERLLELGVAEKVPARGKDQA